MNPVTQAILQGFELGQRGKQHAQDLELRMAGQKASEAYRQRELGQQDDAERLKYGEQGLDLDTIRAGRASADAGAAADQALGPGTADAAGIGSSGVAGTADAGMDTFTSRMGRKQEAGVQDTEAQAEQRKATADWMKRRRAGPGGGSGSVSAQVAAHRAILAPLEKKIAMGEDLSPEDQDTYDSTKESLAKIAGSEYTPKDRNAPPPAAKPGFFDKMASGLGKIKSALSSSKDPKQVYMEARQSGKSPADAHKLAFGN